MRRILFKIALILTLLSCTTGHTQIIRETTDAPFTATRTSISTRSDGVIADTGLIARRSDGSTYTELRNPNGKDARELAGYIIILDISKHRTIELYPAYKKYRLSEDPNLKAYVRPTEYVALAMSTPQPAGTKRQQGDWEYTSLGERQTQGVIAIGSLKTRTDGYTIEDWYSPALDLKLESKNHQVNPEIVTVTTFTGIHLGEPDPNLFEIPAGYTEDTYLKDKQARATIPTK
jgi:hypothetical protein